MHLHAQYRMGKIHIFREEGLEMRCVPKEINLATQPERAGNLVPQ